MDGDIGSEREDNAGGANGEWLESAVFETSVEDPISHPFERAQIVSISARLTDVLNW
jgi:hypothetical protein